MGKGLVNVATEEIYNKYEYFIDIVYKEFSFLNLNKNDYHKLVFNVIEKSKINYDGSMVYHIYLQEKISEVLFAQINKLLNDDGKAFSMLANYIKHTFEKPSIYSYAILYLKKISELFSNANYFPDPDLIIKLIAEKTKFSRAIEVVVQNHVNDIENGTIDKLFDETVGLMIQVYCGINKIKGKNDISIHSIDNLYTTDTVRAYLNEISDIPLLTEQEQRKYGYMLLDGSEDAKQKLIEGNLYLVVSIAAKYIGSGMPFGDLIQDGNEGLIRAASRYDVRKGYRFSTYAAWWITCKIRRALEVNIYRYNKLNPVSLNEMVKVEGDTELGDFLVDESGVDGNNYIRAALPSDIKKLFADCKLTEKETKVMILLYGLGGKAPMSQADIGRLDGIGREGVRRTEVRALKKLRTSPYLESFAIYLDNPEAGLKKLNMMREKYAESALYTFKRDFEDIDVKTKKR